MYSVYILGHITDNRRSLEIRKIFWTIPCADQEGPPPTHLGKFKLINFT